VGIKDRINRAVKQREPFRPFAPAALEDQAPKWFVDAPNDMTPFMTTVCTVPENRQAALAAVNHGGTARVQTVTKERAPALAEVLTHLATKTDVPVVLLTSLNGPGEPIVATGDDAIGFFLQHPVDSMVIDDLLLTK
jgi:carbamoyltransferase